MEIHHKFLWPNRFAFALPKYISFFFMGSGSLVALRALRLLRVFRILKLSRYIGESNF